MRIINKLLPGLLLSLSLIARVWARPDAIDSTGEPASIGALSHPDARYWTRESASTGISGDEFDTIQAADTQIVVFHFVPGRDMFYIPWSGNNVELDRLYALVDEHRAAIDSGELPLHVAGYSASMRLDARDRELAGIRARRVKSELITVKGLINSNFRTTTHIEAYVAPDGSSHKNMVVVTLHVPEKDQPASEPESTVEETKLEDVTDVVSVVVEEPASEVEPAAQEFRLSNESGQTPTETEVEPIPEPKLESVVGPQQEPEPKSTEPSPYVIAVRTNLLYDGFLLPTLGVEWRATRDIGVKVDGSLSYWGDASDRGGSRNRTWFVSPEVRWYLLDSKRFYVGMGANVGQYNIYKGTLGWMFSKERGYQGSLWNVGVTVGYQVYLSRSFSLDFNIGLGYTSSKYDSFAVENGVRVSKSRGVSKSLWGPTQAGINLVWTIGGKRK
jgi:hypothetical protein